MAIGKFGARDAGPVSRRTLLRAGAGLAGGALLPSGLILPALAEDQPALGTWPDGSSGSSVFVGLSVPRTGTYAAAGEDLIKGYELAIEHLNAGSEIMTKISEPALRCSIASSYPLMRSSPAAA